MLIKIEKEQYFLTGCNLLQFLKLFLFIQTKQTSGDFCARNTFSSFYVKEFSTTSAILWHGAVSCSNI
ncbi:unnamed protein product [Lathyrus sativus]|nr:unnamed protein product [Lathyrus sativus]